MEKFKNLQFWKSRLQPTKKIGVVLDKLEPTPTPVHKGLWTLSETGTLIRCRQWRVLDSQFRFFFDGRIMASPGNPVFWIFMIIYTITTLLVFLCFDIYPEFRSNKASDYVIPTVAIIASIMMVHHILQVVLVEPGFVPRPSAQERNNNYWIYNMVLQNQLQYVNVSTKLDELHEGREYEYFCSKEDPESGRKSVYRQEILNDKEIQDQDITLFCEKCCHFRLEKVGHCDDCGCCIDHFHHHCFIFGVCIGRRNYGAFLRLLFLANFLTFLVGYLSTRNFICYWIESDFATAFRRSPTIFVLLSALVLPPCGLVSAICLLIFNIYQILANKEPFGKEEMARFAYNSCSLMIFAQRVGNLLKLMFSKYPISQARPREIVDVVAVPRYERQLWSTLEKETLEILARQARQARKIRRAAKKRKGKPHPTDLVLKVVDQAKPERRMSILKRLQSIPMKCTAPRLAAKASPARSFPPSFKFDMTPSTETGSDANDIEAKTSNNSQSVSQYSNNI